MDVVCGYGCGVWVWMDVVCVYAGGRVWVQVLKVYVCVYGCTNVGGCGGVWVCGCGCGCACAVCVYTCGRVRV